MVTIKDVAKHANVSISTVSRVLNDSDHPVNPETKKRILEAIEELGFYPNAMARSLQLNKTKTIGLLVPDIANPYYPGIVRGVEDVARELGYTVILCNADRSRERTQQYLRVLREKRVDGIIFTGGGAVEDAVQGDFLESNSTIATVVIGKHRANLPSVRVDNVQASCDACEHLIKNGHKKIVTITGPETSTTAQDRLKGYRKALSQYELVQRTEWVIRGDFEFESGYRAVEQLLKISSGGVTAILAQNDLMAIGAIKALNDKSIKVPEEIAVVGFDDIPIASFYNPKLSTVAVPVYQLGSTAMRVLMQLLNGKEVPSVTTLETKVVIRESSF
ncbi:MAG: LacI family DNA-binding transcriptional regulator [Desulfitobacterium hafniense]|nr:LacI family DNA-binding transcriptional regulator [Desulfitobacterium hafniense]